MNPWRVILATVVIFGAGVLTGAAVANINQKQRPKPAPAAARGPLPPFPFNTVQKRDYLGKLDRQLELTQEQYESIEEILLQGNERIRTVWDPIAPKMREELRKMRERIRAELTPEQLKKFEHENPKTRKALKNDGVEGSKPGKNAAKSVTSNTTTNKPVGDNVLLELVPVVPAKPASN